MLLENELAEAPSASLLLSIRKIKTYQSEVATNDRTSAEALDGTILSLVPVPERLRALAVCSVFAH